MTSGIYRITCVKNGKSYVGSSQDIPRRWKEHKNRLRANRHINPHFQNAWNKYGEDSFVFSVVEKCDKDCLLDKEQGHFDTGIKGKMFNASFIAGRVEMTTEVRAKMSQSSTGKNNSSAKLTEKDVLAIREDTREHKDISEEYAVSPSHIKNIIARRKWKHI